MRVAKSRLVNLLISLGFPKAVKWNNEVLTNKVATLHEICTPDMDIDNRYQKLFEKIYHTTKNNIAVEILDDTDNPVEEIIKNTNIELKLKPIEELPEGQTKTPPKSESEVTIVPDVEEDIDEENDKPEVADDSIDSVTSDPVEVSDEGLGEISDETEKQPEAKTGQKTRRTTKEVSNESVTSDTEKSENLPVYKSKLGKPQQIRRPLFTFEMLDIPVGAKLYFTKDPSKVVTVHGKKTVLFEELFGEEPVSLTNLTKKLLDLPRDVQPTGYWTYEGVTLKKLYYDKFPDTGDKSVQLSDRPKPHTNSASRRVPGRKTECWDVFHWDGDVLTMNPVERCLVSDSLSIETISELTNLSVSKVTQLLVPLVRYGLVTKNDDGTFARKSEQQSEIETKE